MCYEGVTVRVKRTYLFTSLAKQWSSPFFTIQPPTAVQEGVVKIHCDCVDTHFHPYINPAAFLSGTKLKITDSFQGQVLFDTLQGETIGFTVIRFIQIELDIWLFR